MGFHLYYRSWYTPHFCTRNKMYKCASWKKPYMILPNTSGQLCKCKSQVTYRPHIKFIKFGKLRTPWSWLCWSLHSSFTSWCASYMMDLLCVQICNAMPQLDVFFWGGIIRHILMSTLTSISGVNNTVGSSVNIFLGKNFTKYLPQNSWEGERERERWLFKTFCKVWTSSFQRPNPSISSSLLHKGGWVGIST